MKNIIYRINYLPHVINNVNPKYYCGSKFNWKGNYFGSPASSRVFDYTQEMSLKEWWKSEIRKDKSNFYLEIIELCDDNITPQELVLKELSWHTTLNVMGDEYFNQALATRGFCANKRIGSVGSVTKEKQSEKTKEYWNSPAGQSKRERMIARNKLPKKRKYLWEFISPTGEVYVSNNLNSFCQDHDLIPENMYVLTTGKTGSTQHKGWKSHRLK